MILNFQFKIGFIFNPKSKRNNPWFSILLQSKYNVYARLKGKVNVWSTWDLWICMWWYFWDHQSTKKQQTESQVHYNSQNTICSGHEGPWRAMSKHLQRVPALRALWDFEKTMLHEIPFCGTVLHCCRLQAIYSPITVKNFVTVYTAFYFCNWGTIEVIYYWDYRKKSS